MWPKNVSISKQKHISCILIFKIRKIISQKPDTISIYEAIHLLKVQVTLFFNKLII